MKLYIWVDPYSVSYGSSLLVVAANDLEEARVIAFDKLKAKSYSCGGMFESSTLPKRWKLKKPDRVLSLPCAEWYEWSE